MSGHGKINAVWTRQGVGHRDGSLIEARRVRSHDQPRRSSSAARARGERGQSARPNDVPEKPRQRREDHQPRGAIYRLSGTQPDPIDPDFAKIGGSSTLPDGLCIYGFSRASSSSRQGGPGPLRLVPARSPKGYYGDDIVNEAWVTSTGEAIVQAETQKGNVVLSQAKATYKA